MVGERNAKRVILLVLGISVREAEATPRQSLLAIGEHKRKNSSL